MPRYGIAIDTTNALGVIRAGCLPESTNWNTPILQLDQGKGERVNPSFGKEFIPLQLTSVKTPLSESVPDRRDLHLA